MVFDWVNNKIMHIELMFPPVSPKSKYWQESKLPWMMFNTLTVLPVFYLGVVVLLKLTEDAPETTLNGLLTA